MTSDDRVEKNRVNPRAAEREATEARLDAALADSFPASDPVAITVRRAARRPDGGEGQDDSR